MYVIAIHSISDPEKFWGAADERLVDGTVGDVSRNEFFGVNEQNAQGLPG
jgi:hypothetical protein